MTAFTSILVDIDATARVQFALRRAADLARMCGARLRIVDVIPASGSARHIMRSDRNGEVLRWRRQQLRQVASSVGDVCADVDVLVGSPVDVLLEDVERFGHDLVVRAHARDVVALEPHDARSVDAQLFRRCPCPVWAVGPGVPPAQPRIAAAIDVCPDDQVKQQLSAQVMDAALLFKKMQGGSLSLIHAWQPAAEKHLASRASDADFVAHLDRSRRRAEAGIAAFLAPAADRLIGTTVAVRRGRIEDVLPAFVVAEGIDLVVVGSAGRTGLSRHFFGNTAERLLERLPCSVVAVKSAEERSWVGQHLRRVSG